MNDAGVSTKLGKLEGCWVEKSLVGSRTFYCGRWLVTRGKIMIPGSDGLCEQTNGPNYPDCSTEQQRMRMSLILIMMMMMTILVHRKAQVSSARASDPKKAAAHKNVAAPKRAAASKQAIASKQAAALKQECKATSEKPAHQQAALTKTVATER